MPAIPAADRSLGAGLRHLLLRATPVAGPWFARALLSTCRISWLGTEVRDRILRAPAGFIAVLWHQHFLLALECLAGRKAVLLLSRSRDGEFPARYALRFGHRVVRGSSSEGGSGALRRVIRLVSTGYPAVVTVDGPKGPSRVMKPGCILAAREAGVPVVPIGCAISRALYLRSWDRTAVPLPGSRIVLGFGDPIPIPAGTVRPEFGGVRARIEESMHRLERRCRRAAGSEPDGTEKGATW